MYVCVLCIIYIYMCMVYANIYMSTKPVSSAEAMVSDSVCVYVYMYVYMYVRMHVCI